MMMQHHLMLRWATGLKPVNHFLRMDLLRLGVFSQVYLVEAQRVGSVVSVTKHLGRAWFVIIFVYENVVVYYVFEIYSLTLSFSLMMIENLF